MSFSIKPKRFLLRQKSSIGRNTRYYLKLDSSGVTQLTKLSRFFFIPLFLSTFFSSFLFSSFLFSNTAQAKEVTQTKPLRIAVAANFAPVLEKLLNDFHQQTGIKTQVIVGATGAIYQQVYHGAPYDVFLSADESRPQALEKDNLIVANSRVTYAYGQIAFWSATSTLNNLRSLESFIKANSRFAIANPKIAPYGKAAKEALIQLGLWENIEDKLITSINIGQTFQQIRSQAVSFGIVANSQLVLNKLSGYAIAQEHHAPIKQQLVIIKSSKQIKNAKKLSDYLISKTIQKEISQYGYYQHD